MNMVFTRLGPCPVISVVRVVVISLGPACAGHVIYNVDCEYLSMEALEVGIYL